MILYNPLSGDAASFPILRRPRTCFVMTKLGDSIPAAVKTARKILEPAFRRRDFKIIDAESVSTGRDYLLKIWKLIVGVPVCIAIVDGSLSAKTVANVFYELGYADSLGKETLIVKTKDFQMPSDFVRTEYIVVDQDFKRHLSNFIDELDERASYYATCAEMLERDPLLSIDYYRRAFLLSGKNIYCERTAELMVSADLRDRAANSVEMRLAAFATENSVEGSKLAGVALD